jgi:hypothetical protein
MMWQTPIAGMAGVVVGYVIGVTVDLGQAPANVPAIAATREPTPAWSERAKTVPVPVLLPVAAPEEPPRAEPQLEPQVAPATTAAERRVMQERSVCYPGYKQDFKYRGVWHWRCKYN